MLMPDGSTGSRKIGSTNGHPGRLPTFDVDILVCQLDEYIDNTDDPLIQEFCYQNNLSKSHFYELEKTDKRLSDMKEKLLSKQECHLVRKSDAMSIFRLKQKQFGYTDKVEHEVTETKYVIELSKELKELPETAST